MARHKSRKTAARLSFGQVLIALLVLSAVLSMAAVSSVYAKYLRENEQNATVHTNDFYFESDLLSESGKEYSLNPGTAEISFTLKNFADELRVSDKDITVTLTVTNGATLDPQTVTLTADNKSAQVVLSGLVDGGTYTVTATGEAGYQKTLKATFTVLSDPAAAYYHVDDDSNAHEAYVLLTVWTGNLQGEVSVTPPAGLIPDNTWQGMADVKTGDDITGNLGEYSSVAYRFFKSDKTQKYTVDDFKVTVDGNDAHEGKLN